MSDLCSQLAPCPPCPPSTPPLSPPSPARAACWLCQRRRWRQKGKVQSVARLHSSRLPPHLCRRLRLRLRHSSLVVGRICLAFVSYFLGWFSAKIPSCLAIVYCSYCCCLLLFLLFLLFPLLQTISWYLPNQINCTLLFCFISLYDIWNLIGNVDVHPCGTCVWLHQPTVATLILSMILFFNS